MLALRPSATYAKRIRVCALLALASPAENPLKKYQDATRYYSPRRAVVQHSLLQGRDGKTTWVKIFAALASS
eukprot:416020-Pleurochrysis_carterae.AAC.1